MPLSTPPFAPAAASGKRSRSATPPYNDTEIEDEAETAVEEPIPFLTTLSMNHNRMFYSEKSARQGLLDVLAGMHGQARSDGARATIADTELKQFDSEADGADVSVVQGTSQSTQPTAIHPPEDDEDVTLLHSMLLEIMDAAECAVHSSETVSDSTLPACAYLLRTYFHFSSGAFKPQQQAVCFSVLAGHSTLAVCPTGWGKSLCYQFPMLVHRLLFECRYEQWCRQSGVTSTLTRTEYTLAEKESEDCSGASSAPSPVPEVQLPADLYSRFCIVVSPLLALMEDQAEKVNRVSHLSAFVLSSKVGADREAQLFREMASPLCSLDILFVSPEKFIASVPLRRLVRAQRHRLAMLCVDEVHCVSGWAYDFRPTFMYVSRVLDSPLLEDAATASSASLGTLSRAAHRIPYLCLTATATAAVISDIQRSFAIDRTVLCADDRRDNLHLQAVDLVSRHAAFHKMSDEREKDAEGSSTATAREPSARVVQDALLEAVRELPTPMLVYVQSRADADELAGLLSTKLSQTSSTVSHGPSAGSARAGGRAGAASRGVFQARQFADMNKGETGAESVGHSTETTAVAAVGRANGLVVRCYHAALARSMRTATQRQFLDGQIDVLVATVAFGMGIDKANIRSVVHASAPSSLEGYVQETGRAGRDGQPSFCRILYNPFDFYDLRSRLWTALLAPAEMLAIVRAILSGPTTRVGPRLMLVSPSALSTELGFSEEAVATVLFLLLTGTARAVDPASSTAEGAARQYSETGSAKASPTVHAPFRAVLGSYPLRYKILSVQGEAEREGDAHGGGATASLAAAAAAGGGGGGVSAFTPHGAPSSVKRRRTAAGAAAVATAGVGLLLRQLGASDAVLELCRVMPSASNQIEMANRLSMPLAEFQQRMQDLIDGGTVTVARYGVPTALLVELSDTFAEAASPAGQEAVAQQLLATHRGRLDAQVIGLRRMFDVLSHPSHERISQALKEGGTAAATATAASAPLWSPPGKGCGKLKAVSIANAFVEENRLRIHSTYEAVRALMGIRPKSLILHGKYAGQMPLAQSWYVSSPYFGALRTFELAWVLQILAPHNLDSPAGLS